MKPFRYLRDPLFLVCLGLYFINRLVLKPFIPNPISQSYLNDLICIPFWVPIMLWTMRVIRIRRDDRPPLAHEILIPLIIWSIAFELIAPYSDRYRGLAYSDPLDILCYACGALIAGLFWQAWYRMPESEFPSSPPSPTPAETENPSARSQPSGTRSTR